MVSSHDGAPAAGAKEPQLAPVTYLFGGGPPLSPAPAAGAPALQEPALQAPASERASGVNEASAPADQAVPASVARSARRAENVSLNGLTRRNMSRWEIEKLLRSRSIDEEIISAEIERLEGVGLIDDTALAETLVRTQHERKGLGKQGLIAELRRRRIDQDTIDDALSALDVDDEQQRANDLAVKRAAQLSSYDAATAKRRLTAYLMRKGYSSSIVQAATKAALDNDEGGVRFR
ncbi:MAG: RecX family transcriptional regulator [Homoserinimonas sp.]|nr:RecX family transcriptional regulator [Homoserinimonas sp.]